MPTDISSHLALKLYEGMVRTRYFDACAVNLQRIGQCGTFPSSLGQEATSVGLGSAMQAEDVLCGYYRDQGTHLYRGQSMLRILQYWGGDVRGNINEHNDDLPICVPIATQCAHGVGMAYADTLKKRQRTIVITIGDGGLSKGDFYESLNFAALHQLRVLFVIINNRYAISTPLSQQNACQALYKIGQSQGVTGTQVDGNDVLKVHQATCQALDTIATEHRPMIIEYTTYRMADHTTADHSLLYRSQEELDAAQADDPINRLRQTLLTSYQIPTEKLQSITDAIKTEVETASQDYLNLYRDTA